MRNGLESLADDAPAKLKKIAGKNEFGGQEEFYTAPLVAEGKVLVQNGAGDGGTRGWLAAPVMHLRQTFRLKRSSTLCLKNASHVASPLL